MQLLSRNFPADLAATAQGLNAAVAGGLFMGLSAALSGVLFEIAPSLAFAAMSMLSGLALAGIPAPSYEATR